jgi:hypothetical protein
VDLDETNSTMNGEADRWKEDWKAWNDLLHNVTEVLFYFINFMCMMGS